MALNVYQQHHGSNISLPRMGNIEDVRRLAEASAQLGHNAFYRVFEVTDGVTREQFKTAFSVLGGVVKEHPSVTFPLAHWG